jgi:hypothetical protein
MYLIVNIKESSNFFYFWRDNYFLRKEELYFTKGVRARLCTLF